MTKRQLQKIGIYCLASVLMIGAYLGIIIYRDVYTPMHLQNNELIIFRMDSSSSAKTLAYVLQSQKLIRSARVFLNVIRIRGLSKNLKAGIYKIKLGESANQLLQRVVNGDVLRESFSIIEGTTQQQVINNLLHATFLNYNNDDWQSINGLKLSFIDKSSLKSHRLADSPMEKEVLLDSRSYCTGTVFLGAGEKVARSRDLRCNSAHSDVKNTELNTAEGLLLADTYQYNAGSDAHGLLLQAHTALVKYLFESWHARDSNIPYKNPYELLIVASIIEKETALINERRLISGVIVNRLKQHMPLQMDPTVIYALGKAYTGKLTHDNLRVDSPYNSYIYRGLPPTPIAMVGKDSIDAASHPLMTDYLYFVAKGDGTHLFSKNYQQQRLAIDKYLKKRDP